MKLIYCYIKKYRNFVEQEIPLCSGFQVLYSENELRILKLGYSKQSKIIFDNENASNIQVVVGKTGAGKTNLLQLIGQPYQNRMHDNEKPEYFLIYHLQDNEYAVEICNMNVNAALNPTENEIKRHKEFERIIHFQNMLLTRWFSTDDNGCIKDVDFNYSVNQVKTVIINCFDLNGFSDKEYTESRQESFDKDSSWAMRLASPFQKTDVLSTCEYLNDYIKSFGESSAKKCISFTLKSVNWSENADDFLSEELMNSDYKLFKTERLKKQSERMRYIPVEEGTKRAQNVFIHDLMMDYALYMRAKIERNQLFYNHHPDAFEPDEEQRKILDYQYEKRDNQDGINPAVLPDGLKLTVGKRIVWLAKYIDRLNGEYAENLMWQLSLDILSIGKVLRKFSEKFFTEETFSIPITELFEPKNRKLFEELSENMEQYVPDDTQLFPKDILPYEISCISSGERQGARIFGAISEYCEKIRFDKESVDLILIMDEPESHMHPEFCRCFMSNLIRTLKRLSGDKYKNIQTIISTHSPFMLSDVLPEQITRIDVDEAGYGLLMPMSEKQYFASNIYTIMADSFFLEYTIGEYSRQFLQNRFNTLKKLSRKDNALTPEEKAFVEETKEIIPCIGDEMIKSSFEILLELFDGQN